MHLVSLSALLTLVAYASADSKSAKIKFASCNGCFPTDGGSDCKGTNYVHYGDGRGDCDDEASIFTNKGYCKTAQGTKFKLDNGKEAEWNPISGCDDTTEGEHLGSLSYGDGPTDYYTCTSHKENFDVYCGVDSACMYDMYCEDPEPQD